MSFPAKMPKEKPTNIRLSSAMERMYDTWNPMEDRGNEFYSNFKYSRLEGIGKEEGISRRDPSSVIKVEDMYYVWYTKRMTVDEPVGIEDATETIPAYDWDLCDIWYATSQDGFIWKEQGIAVERAVEGKYGDRSVTTPDILSYGGKYYLFFQAFTGPFQVEKGDYCNVSLAIADTPHGPWLHYNEPIVELGKQGEWDSKSIHDPFVIMYRDKFWLYYKGSPLEKGEDVLIRAQGVAIAEKPWGPYVKADVNPIINSGHETCFYPYKDGVCAILSLDGPEKNTVQFAKDGINFEVKSNIQLPPIAPGPYVSDICANDLDGKGVAWGLCHINARGGGADQYCFIARFDCDLHRELSRPEFKKNNIRYNEDTFFQRVTMLTEEQKLRIE